MAFCKFSSESKLSTKTSIDNIFFETYLLNLPEKTLKVYLYGLYLCNQENEVYNTLEFFSKELDCSEDDILSCFLYLQEESLVQVLNCKPFEVRYLPIRKNVFNKKYNKTKYNSFNIQMQEILNGRMITPNEYNEYYCFLDTYKMEEQALIKIAKYCADLKGNNIGYSYILTIAKNWAYEGYLTTNKVSEKISDMEVVLNTLNDILNICKIKLNPSLDDVSLYKKWTKDYGFDTETIIYVINKVIKNKKNIITKLEQTLTKYYENKLLSISEITSYELDKQNLYDTAISVVKNLGLYYESLDSIIETYIIPWKNMGFEKEVLDNISNYCFKNSIRTLNGMNDIIEKFYKLGIITNEALFDYINDLVKKDKEIKEVLDKLGIVRNVNNFDRKFYNNWVREWNFSQETVLEICNYCFDKAQPMYYLNKLLSNLFALNLSKKEDCIKYLNNNNFTKLNNVNKKISIDNSRNYTDEELNSLFDNIKEIEI